MFELSSASTSGMLVIAALVTILSWIITNFIAQRNKSIRYGKPVPGSMGWPLIGHLPYFKPFNIYPLMDYFTRKYGPIFRIKLGSYNAIVITDYNLVKKAFSSADFTFRADFMTAKLFSMDGHGLLLSSGNIWHEQRRFALRLLRDLGMGKSSLEAHVQAEIRALFTEWRKLIGKPIDVNVSLNIAITNIIWAIAAGQRMDYDDPKFIKLVGEVNKKIELGTGANNPLFFFPWIMRLIPQSFLKLESLIEIINSFNSYAQDLIDGHKKAIDYDDPKDFVDHFLVEQKKEENNPETTFTNTQLLATISDLFLAGGETTATTLRWAILLISQDSFVQKRIQDEIDQIVGKDRYPNIDDYNKMPYTVAVVNEVTRFADLLPLSIFHWSSKDTTFEGFHIPKDSVFIGALGCSHRSRKYWAKPYEFYPEHFLDADGNLRQNVEGYFPFSTGKRTCAGERLARTELFDFIASFFQHFNMRLADSPKPNFDGYPKSGVIRWPNPYKVIMEVRQ